MFPIGDENPTERRPYVNYVFIALNVLIFLFTWLAPSDEGLIRWTMIPARLRWDSLFTNIFLHAGWAHLLGNMLFLWIFGDNIEDRLGHVGYVVFYFVCGLAADAAHIMSNPDSPIPTLGASGAISGVMGAYLVFFPQQRIKTVVWFGYFIDVIRIPAFLWMGIWFLEQLFLGARGLSGGVAYGAHIGGFVAGAAIGGAVRLLSQVWSPGSRSAGRLEPRPSEERRPFVQIPEDPGIEWMDDPQDAYSVLRLADEPGPIGRISEIAGAITGEAPSSIARRLEVTRGMVARAVPRALAERIQRELHTLGHPSAIILHNRANFPPTPATVEAASWDDRTLRLRAGEQIVLVAWSSPFLYVGARKGDPFVDLFINRRTAFRIVDRRGVPLTEVDAASRTEISKDFSGLARAILERRGAAAVNEGVRIAAANGPWGWLDFRNAEDYDDYLFWLYNLILSQVPIARG